MNLTKLWLTSRDDSWSALDSMFTAGELSNLDTLLGGMPPGEICPPREHIFRAFGLPLSDVKVVIVGQDPYTNGRATGLAFSVTPDNRRRHPNSLKEILLELRCDTGQQGPADGDLTCWAEQGILLLNTAFTVPGGGPAGAHASEWLPLRKRVIELLAAQRHRAIIFCLWGDAAKRLARLIQEPRRHFVLTAGHPKARSNAHQPFRGCRHFSMVDALLAKQGERPISWDCRGALHVRAER